MKRRAILYYVFSFALVLSTLLPVKAQNEEYDETWRWVQFTTESGLPSNRVTEVHETSDGTVWAIAAGRLAWYDGFQWQPMDLPHDMLDNYSVSILGEDGDSLLIMARHTLAIGTKAGFRSFLSNSVDHAVSFGHGAFLIVSHSSLYIYEKGSLKTFEPSRKLTEGKTLDIWKTESGNYWVNLLTGLYRWEGGSWVQKIAAGSVALSPHLLAENTMGSGILSIDIPFEERGLWEWETGSLPRRNMIERELLVRALGIGPHGEVIAAYVSGEIRIRQQGKWQPLHVSNPQVQDILTIQYRKNGDVWIGTEQGLFLWRRSPTLWTNLRHPSPDPRNSINEILFTHDGALWLATNDGVEIRRTNGTIEHIDHIGNTELYTVTGLGEDDHGAVWISSGASFEGAFRWDGSLWTHFPILAPESESTAVKIHKIKKDRRGRLWFLGLGKYFQIPGVKQPGAFVMENGRFTRWGVEEGLINGRVYAFAEGLDSAYWFGTFGGISRWKDGRWRHFTTTDGLPNNRVFVLAIDHENRMWFGANGQTYGLGYIEPNGTVHKFSTADGLVDNDVWDIQVDSVGRVWAACRGGLNCYDRGVWLTFDQRSGLGHAPLWPVLPHCGEVYVGTMGRGLAILHWDGQLMPPPRVTIDRPTMEGKNILLRWRTFAYWGEVEPADLLCRYRINDRPWSPWDRRKEVVESQLPWGQYTLEVQAKNLLGSYDQQGTRTALLIPPPLYLQPLFILPTGLLIIAVIALGIILLVRKKRHDVEIRRSEAKFRAVAEMTASAIFIYHDACFLFVNPGAELLTCYTEAELLRMQLQNLIHPEYRERVREQEKTRSGTTAVPHRMEFKIVTKRGEERWIDYTWGWIRFQGAPATLGTAFDITERKLAEEKLRALTSELSLTEERERRRMATHLHDVIGQTLALCKIKVRSIQKSDALHAAEHHLQELRELIEQSILQTQELTFELCPPILYELSFESAVEWLTERLGRQHGIAFSFENDKGTKPLAIDLKIVLFQAVREILINAIKHAEAQHVAVSTVREGTNIRIDIADDGVGFDATADPRRTHSGGGFGLFNIRERLSHLDGTLAISSAQGRGTRVTITAPLHDNVPDAAGSLSVASLEKSANIQPKDSG
ncbi:MAG: PAS domain S-box protein [Ignavibacteriae bacterium]|nr:PAS domain S-box protein [Ignavibacteria bacterium]MBI3364320.1 PAS domain S-box protein [Ignavibacteriota bacterium]